MIFGVDISGYQTNVNYQKAVSDGGVQFAIIRAGYGRNANQKDNLFEQHYSGFKKVNVPVGSYQYSYASDVAGAKAEANAMIQWLKGKTFELPIYYDMEDNNVASAGKQTIIRMALAWCEAIEAAGYKAGVYSNEYWWKTYLDADQIGEKYSVWAAKWSSSKPSIASADVWQFGGETNFIRSNTVAGFNGAVDQDYILNESILNASAHEVKKSEPSAQTTETQEASASAADSSDKYVNISVRQLKNGDTGNDVKMLQAMLNAKNFNCGTADGIFGNNTEQGVKSFQTACKIASDGIFGIQSWSKLMTK